MVIISRFGKWKVTYDSHWCLQTVIFLVVPIKHQNTARLLLGSGRRYWHLSIVNETYTFRGSYYEANAHKNVRPVIILLCRLNSDPYHDSHWRVNWDRLQSYALPRNLTERRLLRAHICSFAFSTKSCWYITADVVLCLSL